MIICSHCGAENIDKAKFCINCGKQLQSNESKSDTNMVISNNSFISLIKSSKFLSIVFFIFLIFIIQSHWRYVGSSRFSNVYVRLKVDNFSGFKYYEMYLTPDQTEYKIIGLTSPIYINNQDTMYYLALYWLYIETFFQWLLLIANTLWIVIAWGPEINFFLLERINELYFAIYNIGNNCFSYIGIGYWNNY